MKKLLIALALVSVIVLALATTVTADNGPHGGFTATTEKCAGCHRIHRAQSDDGFLLVAGNVYLLCVSCHNGTGAYTNVVNGTYVAGGVGTVPGLAAPLGTQGDGGAPLFGGGFVNTLSAHTWLGKDGYDQDLTNLNPPVSGATTSTHTVKGMPLGAGTATGAGTVWGSGDINVTNPAWTAPAVATAADHTLECTSCHDPHGRAGRAQASGLAFNANSQGGVLTGNPMASYRLLRFEPEGSNGFEMVTATGTTVTNTLTWWSGGNSQSTDGITVRETANYWYTINSDYTKDGTLQMYRNRFDTNAGQWTGWSSYIAQYGDPVGRSWTYFRPAIQVTSATTSFAGGYLSETSSGTYAGNVVTMYSCRSTGDMTAGGTMPPNPGAPQDNALYISGTDFYPCTTISAGPAFNNNSTTLSGIGGINAGRTQVGYWCGTCHDKYVAASSNAIAGAAGNARTANSGDSQYTYRHNSTSSVPCVDCHFAHGSSADMALTNSTYPATSANGAASLAAPAGGTGSYLLKLDNRSTCLKCHGHDVNFQYTPIP